MMSVRIHEPPTPVHLLDPEKPGRFGSRVEIAAKFATTKIAGLEASLFGRPLLFELSDVGDLALPVGWDPLAEFVHHWFGVKDVGARILFGQRDRSDFDRRIPQRRLHAHADLGYSVQRPISATTC